MGFFTGKTVILTGGGRATLSDGRCGSIGYGIATAYAKEGANLVITGRNVKKLEDAKEELERLYGIKVLPVQADIEAGADNEAAAKHVVEEAVKEFGSKIAVGIDAKSGFVATEGWVEKSDVYFTDLAKRMEDVGVKNIIFTDIQRDGTLAGPNIEQLVEINNAVSCDITASGGVTNISDILSLRDKKLYGAICGKSIYQGTLDLREALEVCK